MKNINQEIEIVEDFKLEELEERLEMEVSSINKLWHKDMKPPEPETNA